MSWAFEGLQMFGYQLIMADPAWRFLHYSDEGLERSPEAHYDCMNLDEIKALPVDQLASENCLLIMWTTGPMLRHSLEVLDAWRFEYVTLGAWAKTTKHLKIAFGLGYVLRGAAEFFILGKIGTPRLGSKSERNLILDDEFMEKLRNGAELEGNLIVSQRREHSRKPDDIFDLAEAISPDSFKCELFARERRPGFDAWGNEVDADVFNRTRKSLRKQPKKGYMPCPTKALIENNLKGQTLLTFMSGIECEPAEKC